MPHSSTGNMVVTAARPSVADLEQAALSVVRLMQGAAGLASIRIALIGDLAIRKYLPQQPGLCESIEFLVTKSASPSLVKKTILAHGKKSIIEKAQTIFYRHPASGWAVEVKITPEWMCPYLPDSAQPIADIADGDKKTAAAALPYIGLADLIVFKADACGLHESDAGRQRQAHDARALLELASEHFPLQLEDSKLQKVEEALDTLVEHSPPECGRRWWERRLGKKEGNSGGERGGSVRRSVQDILSELGEGLRLDEEENRRTAMQRRPSIFSLSNRGSETSIGSSTPSPTTSSSSSSSQQHTAPPPKMRPRKMSISGSFPRPRRHTQANMDPQPEDLPSPSTSTLHRDYLDVHRLHAAELMDTRGRSSPGISFMTFPGRG